MFYLKKIFSPTCLFISLGILVYTFYKSEIYFEGLKNNYYLKYYFLSIILIILSLISFFINTRIKEYLIICAISFLISIYLFEIYLTCNISDRKNNIKNFDKRTFLEFYNDKKKNYKITTNVYPLYYITKNFKIFPFSGISNSETIFDSNENGYYFNYFSDRFGFNNPDNEWDKKEIEYLIVGDSFAHGVAVKRPNDIASVLRVLSKKPVLNLGYAGNGPLIQYATLREYLKQNVKKILWIYYEGNDLLDLQNELKNNILRKYLISENFSQNLRLRQDEINNLGIINMNKIIKYNSQNKFYLKILNILKLTNTRFYFIRETYETKNEIELKKIINLAKKISSKNNSKIYFIYLPEYWRYKNKTNYNNKNYLLIQKIISELNIPFVDIHIEVFQKERDPLNLFPLKLFGHYNSEGYEKVAKAIFKQTRN